MNFDYELHSYRNKTMWAEIFHELIEAAPRPCVATAADCASIGTFMSVYRDSVKAGTTTLEYQRAYLNGPILIRALLRKLGFNADTASLMLVSDLAKQSSSWSTEILKNHRKELMHTC